MTNKIFTLSDLNEEFWKKVIVIEVDYEKVFLDGYIDIFTLDKKRYLILSEAFENEDELYKIVPFFKRKEDEESVVYPFEVKGNGWQSVRPGVEGYFVRNDVYDAFIEQVEKRKYYSDLYPYIDVNSVVTDMMGWQRNSIEFFDYEENIKVREQREKELEAINAKCERLKLTEEDFIWKSIHPNNIKSNYEDGVYALIFKERDEKVTGYKFSIIYQREHISPLYYKGTNSKIEMYILLEKEYIDVQGPLGYGEYGKHCYIGDWDLDFFEEKTFTDYDINSYGKFLRAFESLDEAKKYAIEVANIRGYADKSNLITDCDNKERIYKNYLRKHTAILEFRKHYEDILKLVCNYEIQDKYSSDKVFIVDAIANKGILDEDIVKELWEYVPWELMKRTQKRSEEIVAKCIEYLEVTKEKK